MGNFRPPQFRIRGFSFFAFFPTLDLSSTQIVTVIPHNSLTLSVRGHHHHGERPKYRYKPAGHLDVRHVVRRSAVLQITVRSGDWPAISHSQPFNWPQSGALIGWRLGSGCHYHIGTSGVMKFIQSPDDMSESHVPDPEEINVWQIWTHENTNRVNLVSQWWWWVGGQI